MLLKIQFSALSTHLRIKTIVPLYCDSEYVTKSKTLAGKCKILSFKVLKCLYYENFWLKL